MKITREQVECASHDAIEMAKANDIFTPEQIFDAQQQYKFSKAIYDIQDMVEDVSYNGKIIINNQYVYCFETDRWQSKEDYDNNSEHWNKCKSIKQFINEYVKNQIK